MLIPHGFSRTDVQHTMLLSLSNIYSAFPERIISKPGKISCPARSPDLSPNDFFLWGHIKPQIYNIRSAGANTLEEL